MSPLTAVELIRQAGGVSVIAHPRDPERGPGLTVEEITELRDAGLFGLEVYHRVHSEESKSELLEIAQKLGLRVTGASDYHSSVKANQLGENATAPEVLDEILDTMTSGLGLV